MKKFKQKNYGKVSQLVKSARENPLSAASLGLSSVSLAATTTNAAINAKRARVDKQYQDKQLEAMNKLTNSLEKVDSSLHENKGLPQKRFIFFRQKNNSKAIDYAIKGAGLGAGVGIVGSGLLPKKLGKEYKPGILKKVKTKDNLGRSGWATMVGEKPKMGFFYDEKLEQDKPGWDKGWRNKVAGIYNNSSDDVAMRKALASLGSIAIGATLGFIFGAVHDLVDYSDRKNVNNRLMKKVVTDLKKIGFKEEQDFTTNPKTATLMKTKVCIGISRSADTLRVLVNTINDAKLSRLSQETTKNLPSMSTRMERVSDRFNDINITTASGQGNSTFVSSIAEKFIRAGYPVQLVEVG